MRYKLPVLIFFCCIGTMLSAQQELGLHFMRDVLQSGKTNPAFMPDQKLIIGLPNVQYHYFHTSGSINDLIDSSSDTTSNLNVGNWINSLQGDNELNASIEVETVRLFYNLGKFGLTLNHTAKLNADFKYTDNFVRLLGEGNAQFAGDTIMFGPRVQLDTYHEIGLGVAYPILDNLNIGVRGKFLSGIANMSTGNSDISLFTDDDIYQISIDSDYSLNSTNLISYSDTSFFDVDFPDDFAVKDFFSGNTGFAFDFGVDWQITNKLTLAASVVDIGKITWDKNSKTFSSKTQETFKGIVIDFPSILQGEIANFSSNIDTIDFNSLFNFKESPSTYSTTLPTKLYLSANYQLSDRFRIGALYHAEFFQGEQKNAFAVNVDAQILDMLSVGAIYGYRFGSYDNLGLNVRLKLGPVQLFATTDNVLTVVRPYDTENANGRIGLNLVFGSSSKEKVEDMEDGTVGR